MKKLINGVADVAAESMEGLALAHPDIVYRDDKGFIARAALSPEAAAHKQPKKKVAVISGGGSGHEPLHAGYVGYGMLDAAIPGPVFTSPTPDPIEAAARTAEQGEGVLFIVKNYTGDVLNFDTAAELLDMDDIAVKQVIVNDDVAVENSTHTAGRRGVAGTVLVEKIAGAAAERGDSLEEVAAIAQKVVDNTRTMGLALEACTVPHVGKPSFELGDNEVEIGIGIHGEPGRRRIPMAPADVLCDELLDPILEDLKLEKGSHVIAMVNGMGGTPEAELYIVYRHLFKRLKEADIVIDRSLVGNYVTSLEMQGASITLMRVDKSLLELYDAPAHTIAFTQA